MQRHLAYLSKDEKTNDFKIKSLLIKDIINRLKQKFILNFLKEKLEFNQTLDSYFNNCRTSQYQQKIIFCLWSKTIKVKL